MAGKTTFIYRPTLRPVGYSTIPEGVEWEFVEAPRSLTTRPDLPTSRFEYGVISTSRRLTHDERSRFGFTVHHGGGNGA